LVENLTAMAGMEFVSGRADEARRHLDEAVAIMIQTQAPIYFPPVLIPLAFVANRDGRHRRAARLLGAAEALRQRHGGAGPPPVAMIHFGDPATDARAALGEDEYERARAEGLGMTEDEIVALAAERSD
jgi:hypothetical protein